jgi:hypothetical protein
MNTKEALDIAWAAGLFEGEGCISRNESSGSRPRWCVILVSSDRDVIDRFHGVVGMGTVRSRKTHTTPEHYKKQWIWRTTKRAEVESLLKTLIPYFGKRRSIKANEALSEISELGPAVAGFRGHRKKEDDEFT